MSEPIKAWLLRFTVYDDDKSPEAWTVIREKRDFNTCEIIEDGAYGVKNLAEYTTCTAIDLQRRRREKDDYVAEIKKITTLLREKYGPKKNIGELSADEIEAALEKEDAV